MIRSYPLTIENPYNDFDTGHIPDAFTLEICQFTTNWHYIFHKLQGES
jgi:hypothetical protein